MPDDMDKRAIRELMENPELSEGVTVYESLASTNAAAKELITDDNAPHGRVIIAQNQTGAYGRRGKHFFTYDGGVYMSVILRPKQTDAETATLITTFAAVAVCNAVFAVSGKQCGVKWVNDVFLNNKKICGILTEAISGTDAVVVGIGLNLAPFENAPPELADIIGSVFEAGEEIPQNAKNRFAADIIETVISYANMFDSGTAKDIMAEYKARSFLIGREITVMPNSGGEYAATAIDIDGKGGLIIKKYEGGEKLTLSSGEVRVKL